VGRRRIWSEFLPAQELGSRATIDLLARFDLEPLVALPPRMQTQSMARALAALSGAGLRVGLWPLLDDTQGYWPSEVNAAAFCARVAEVMEFARQAGARVATVAVDLEPPLGLTRKLLDGSLGERAAIVIDALKARGRDAERQVRAEAVACFDELAENLAATGVETLAVMAPPVVLDLASDTRVWQELLRTPVSRPRWSVVSPLMYSSMIGAALPPAARGQVGVMVHETGRLLARAVAPARACMSLGVVTQGKLGDETAFAAPADLERDVQCALAAGMDDLALFSLEGVLWRGAPESWLEPFTRAGAVAPRGPGSLATRWLCRAAGHAVMGLTRLLR
jgi:hypothetical protein